MQLTLVAALDQAMAIGIGGQLPWHLPGDLRRFRLLTTGHPVLMGRRTFESIGRALPNRRNVVVSRNPEFVAPDGVEVFASLEDALSALLDCDEVFVIGGAQIYAATLPIASRMVLTIVHTRVAEADTYFPGYNPADWVLAATEHFDADTNNAFAQTVNDLRRARTTGAE
jgi:dihydrofolate reductase